MHNVTRQPQFDLGDRLIEYQSGLVMVEIGMFELGCRSIGSPDPFHGRLPRRSVRTVVERELQHNATLAMLRTRCWSRRRL